jgi:5-methylcytosine-specific restriction endonuclease McrA
MTEETDPRRRYDGIPIADLADAIARQAEASLLGAILINNDAFDEIAPLRLAKRDFIEDFHGLVYEVGARLILAGKLATPVTLAIFFPEGDKVDLRRRLAFMAADSCSISEVKNVGHWVRFLARARWRALPAAEQKRLQAEAQRSGDPVRRALDEAQGRGRFHQPAPWLEAQPQNSGQYIKELWRDAELQLMKYSDYLQTEEWQETRADALRRAAHGCQVCNSPGKLDVHHRTYARRGQEEPCDLIVLCAACHVLFHENGRLLDEKEQDPETPF